MERGPYDDVEGIADPDYLAREEARSVAEPLESERYPDDPENEAKQAGGTATPSAGSGVSGTVGVVLCIVAARSRSEAVAKAQAAARLVTPTEGGDRQIDTFEFVDEKQYYANAFAVKWGRLPRAKPVTAAAGERVIERAISLGDEQFQGREARTLAVSEQGEEIRDVETLQAVLDGEHAVTTNVDAKTWVVPAVGKNLQLHPPDRGEGEKEADAEYVCVQCGEETAHDFVGVEDEHTQNHTGDVFPSRAIYECLNCRTPRYEPDAAEKKSDEAEYPHKEAVDWSKFEKVMERLLE